jgi:bacillithiol biosynthesis deacetylase BshB1
MPEKLTLDIVAIAAHRDDVEQTCGGTLLAQAALGWKTGIVDLTRGESGTRGSAVEREAEANEAARILRVSHREALDLPDGSLQNTLENRLKLAAVLRRLRPRVVILPYWQGRHPDHYTSATLGYEACFASGLSKLDLPGVPHRPYKILYASLYADVRPTFVVDIPVWQSGAGQWPLRPRRRDPRTHLRHGPPLWTAGRHPLRRALCTERSVSRLRHHAPPRGIHLEQYHCHCARLSLRESRFSRQKTAFTPEALGTPTVILL